MKPRIFIASSQGSLAVAKAVKAELEDDGRVEAVVWSQAIFTPGRYILEDLLHALNNFNFGIFIFAPDDVALIRGKAQAAVRDNVLFELGLFVGRLGRSSSFIMYPSDVLKMRLPSDLLGIVTGQYDVERVRRGETRAAVGNACLDIRRAITRNAENGSKGSPSWDLGNIYEADSRLLSLLKPKATIRVCRLVAYTCKVAYDWRGLLLDKRVPVDEMRVLARHPDHIREGCGVVGAIPSDAGRVEARTNEIRDHLISGLVVPLKGMTDIAKPLVRFYRSQPVLRGALVEAFAEEERQRIGYLSIYGPRDQDKAVDWHGRGTTSLRMSEDGGYEEHLMRGFVRWFDQMWDHGSTEMPI